MYKSENIEDEQVSEEDENSNKGKEEDSPKEIKVPI